MLFVTVSAPSSSAHLAQPFAGLYDLRAAGALTLRFRLQRETTGAEHVFTADVASSRHERPRRLCFDMRDDAIIDVLALDRADVYFKRSFRHSAHAQVPTSLAHKIRPYGLHYACSSIHQARTLAFARELTTFELATAAWRRPDSIRRLFDDALRWMGIRARDTDASAALPYSDFEARASDAALPAVVYLTRLWDPSQGQPNRASAREQLNAARIELLRTLRRRLGDRCIGGVERSDYALERCPDLVVDDTVKERYLGVMKRNLIGVASRGLHGSTGWKIAEYVAAARCIVSDPLPEGAVLGFEPGRHYLPYETPDECAAACERLLDDPASAMRMRAANERYYLEELKPPVMMMKRLQQALDGAP